MTSAAVLSGRLARLTVGISSKRGFGAHAIIPSSMKRNRPHSESAALSRLQRPQPRREIHFLPLLGLWGAKHLTAWTVYNACKNYGWPKVYRRLLEQSRHFYRQQQKAGSIHTNPSNIMMSHETTKKIIRMAIEAPPQFAAKVSENMQVLQPYIQDLANRAQPNIPSFLVAIAKFIVNSQKPVKVVQDMMGAASKMKR